MYSVIIVALTSYRCTHCSPTCCGTTSKDTRTKSRTATRSATRQTPRRPTPPWLRRKAARHSHQLSQRPVLCFLSSHPCLRRGNAQGFRATRIRSTRATEPETCDSKDPSLRTPTTTVPTMSPRTQTAITAKGCPDEQTKNDCDADTDTVTTSHHDDINHMHTHWYDTDTHSLTNACVRVRVRRRTRACVPECQSTLLWGLQDNARKRPRHVRHAPALGPCPSRTPQFTRPCIKTASTVTQQACRSAHAHQTADTKTMHQRPQIGIVV